MHVPVEQSAIAFMRAVHTVPQPPQFSRVLSGTSHPSAGLLLQSPQPGSHIAIVHRPAAHDAVACASVHRKPHAPQLLGSVAVRAHASPHMMPASHAGEGSPASASMDIEPSEIEPSMRRSACGSAQATVVAATATSAWIARRLGS